MPVLTFGDKSAECYFGWIGNYTTDIADVCGHAGHSQHFMMDGNKNNSNENHDRENAAISRFARQVRERVRSDFISEFTRNWGGRESDEV